MGHGLHGDKLEASTCLGSDSLDCRGGYTSYLYAFLFRASLVVGYVLIFFVF